MNHIVSFSSGLSSALTVERVLDRFEASTVDIVFMDTTFEDEDNYRFMRDCESRWLNKYNITVTVLRDGRNPYQLAESKKMIPNQLHAPCTFKLKIEPFTKYLQGTYKNQELTAYIGYDIFEAHRCEATEKNYGKYGWKVDFPLMWKPIETRKYPVVVRDDWGINPPRMYELGYTHANCGGRCIKQGHGDWIRTLINYPDRFKAIEEWEEHMRREYPATREFGFIKQSINGKKIPWTLRGLREKYEAQHMPSLFDLDSETGCLYCGVGDLVADIDFKYETGV